MLTDAGAIAPLVEDIKSALSGFDDGAFASYAERARLLAAAERLIIAAREPEEYLYFTATQTAQNAAIRSAIGLNLFRLIPDDGTSVSVQQMAQETGADERLISRILRACASTHVFDNPSEGHYSHNAASRAFLKEQNRDMFQQMYDFVGKGTYALPQYFKLTNWKNPNDYHNSAFHLGQNTKLGFWEYLKEDPERMRLFNSGMRSVATIGGENKSSGPFPFEILVGADPGEQVTVVDVGGGRGQALEAIYENYPSIKWNMILQDQPDVVEDAKAKGLPSYIQGQGGSFFEPQTVKGAHAYIFRRIFHDWNDQDSQTILEQTRSALSPSSRILIFDTVVPSVQAPRDLALQDLNMMSFAGMERTDRQWEELLKASGLRLVKFWRSNVTKHAVIEASLP
ncbi:S-adenosyl-L-methionine-dependent methyltransferase [Trichoderma asperelloides]|nr:S-adenosyl-L-methionine-dependent methyltransferase [Trichoderma asperelloides]